MRSTQIIFAFATIFLTQSVMAQGQGKGPPPPPGDVNVVNTPDVNVVNMPDVNVANTPDVNVANVPDVVVVNDGNSPIPVTVQNGVQTIVEWRYIGLTTFEDDGLFLFGGLFGVAAMNKVCAAEFGPGARAASLSEAYFRDDAAVETRSGWVAPGGPMLLATDQSLAVFFPIDAAAGAQVGESFLSPGFAISQAYCARYRTGFGTVQGSRILANGAQVLGACNVTLPVSCSAPVAIPVAP